MIKNKLQYSLLIFLGTLVLISLFFPRNALACTPGEDGSGCTGGCGGCASNAGEYEIKTCKADGTGWNTGGSDCRTSCSGPCATPAPTTTTTTTYNCGAAASCASLGKTGDAGDKICSQPCNSASNSCWTSGACSDTTACSNTNPCPTNLTCPVGCTGTNACISGSCHSNCTSCPTGGGGDGGGGGTTPTPTTAPSTWVAPTCTSGTFSGCKQTGNTDCTDWGSNTYLNFTQTLWNNCSAACASPNTTTSRNNWCNSCSVTWNVPATVNNNTDFTFYVNQSSTNIGWSYTNAYLDNSTSLRASGCQCGYMVNGVNSCPCPDGYSVKYGSWGGVNSGATGSHTLTFKVNDYAAYSTSGTGTLTSCTPAATFTTLCSPVNGTCSAWVDTTTCSGNDRVQSRTVATTPSCGGTACSPLTQTVSCADTNTCTTDSCSAGVCYNTAPSCQTSNSACTTNYCSTSCSGDVCAAPVDPTVSPVTCVSTATYTTNINWTNADNITWVDISSQPTDALRNANYSHRDVSSVTTATTEAPTGFGTYAGTGVSSFITGTTYYARVSNASATNKNSSWVSFSRSLCIPGIPTNLSASCPAPGTTATLNWTAPATGSTPTSYALRISDTSDSNAWNSSCIAAPGDFCDNVGNTTTKSFTTTPDDSYDWWVHACNSAGCNPSSSGSNFTCILPSCNNDCSSSCTTTTQCGNGISGTCSATSYSGGACTTTIVNCLMNKPCTTSGQTCDIGTNSCIYSSWIQAVGDVHSNSGINAAGGP